MAVTGLILGYVYLLLIFVGVFKAIALPSFAAAREAAQENVCINNLRQIEGAKQMFALEYNLMDSDVITDQQWQSILNLLDDPALICPVGTDPYPKPETYGTPPTCPNITQYPEHTLPSW